MLREDEGFADRKPLGRWSFEGNPRWPELELRGLLLSLCCFAHSASPDTNKASQVVPVLDLQSFAIR